ncbi:F-box protein [Arabidopsis thaliana]
MTTSQFKKSKIENNSQFLGILKEKNFNYVPLDVAIEIFMRLPVKSVARFLLLSKFWAEIIRSRHFITSFQVRSSLQPRLLVVFIDLNKQWNCEDWYFFSLSSSTISYLSRVTCPVPDSKFITNPSTGKSTVLGRVQTNSKVAQCFLGYDPVNDEYKLLVLCMKEKMQRHDGRTRILQLSSQHQVFPLGVKKKPWRMIDYTTPHGPVLNSVCIDGVLYYVAFTGEDLSQLSLMRFDLGSEKLDLFTSLPADFPAAFLHGFTLMRYKGKVVLATKTLFIGIEVWVLDQQAEIHGWLKKSFSIKGVRRWLFCDLFITGTTHTGEFILAPRFYSNSFYVIYYNPDTKSLRKTKVEVNGGYDFSLRKTKVEVHTEAMTSSIGKQKQWFFRIM